MPQKPKTHESGQFLAKPWRPHDIDEEVDAAAVDHSEFQVDEMGQRKDVVVAAVDEELIHDASRYAQDDDGRWGQDVDDRHDHQHPGQSHLT